MKVQNLYYKNSYAEAPSWKVLKVLRGLLLKKSPKQGLGQSPKVLERRNNETTVSNRPLG